VGGGTGHEEFMEVEVGLKGQPGLGGFKGRKKTLA
jgi:hypothetical protein